MKIAIVTITGLVLAGLYGAAPAQAQSWQGQPYAQPYGYQGAPSVERRGGYGSSMDERCGRLHREAQDLRIGMDREWNPVERGRLQGRLEGVRERQVRAGCR